jgi:hypothetical protein
MDARLLMKEYTDVQIKIFVLDQKFCALFPNSPFCSFIMNMGPHMVCLGHCDCIRHMPHRRTRTI